MMFYWERGNMNKRISEFLIHFISLLLGRDIERDGPKYF